MKRTANKLIFQNRLRLIVKTIKSKWPLITGMAFMAVVLVCETNRSFLLINPGVPLPQTYTWWFYLAIVLVKMYSVISAPSSPPVVRLYAATVLYTYNTHFFQKRLRLRWFFSFFKDLCASLIISYIVNGLLITQNTWGLSCKLFLYFSCMTMCSWTAFHGNRAVYIWSLLLSGVLSCLLLSSVFQGLLFGMVPYFVTFGGLLFYLFLSKKLGFQIEKYFSCVSFLDASEAAFEQNDYGRMAQLSETTRPKVVRGLTYGDLHPSKSTAILARSCIGLLRIRKELYYMLAGLIIISWLLIKTSVFSSLPLMEVSETRKLLGSLCITMAFNAFNQFQISQAADICTKRLKGLSLPVSDFHVRIGYLLTTLLFTALVCLPLCIIFSRPLYKMALFWFASGISCLLLSFVSDKRWGKRVVTPVSTIILLTGAFLGFVF